MTESESSNLADLDSDDDLVIHFCTHWTRRWWWKRHEVYLHIGNQKTLMKRHWSWDKAHEQALWLNNFFEDELLPRGGKANEV